MEVVDEKLFLIWLLRLVKAAVFELVLEGFWVPDDFLEEFNFFGFPLSEEDGTLIL